MFSFFFFFSDVDVEYELRCFVHKSHLTALTTYNPQTRWGRDKPKLRQVVGMLQLLIQKLAIRLQNSPIGSAYVLDVWIHNNEALVVELNPFGAKGKKKKKKKRFLIRKFVCRFDIFLFV
jgi:hypothetical protein